jgi:plastocyanin
MQVASHVRRRLSPGAAFLVAALAATTLLPSSAARAEDGMVKINDFQFAPARLTVKAGTTVTWRNKDDIPHTITSTTRAFKSKALDTDDIFAFTFIEPGSYEYFCSLHPHMTGTIVVEPAAHAAK